MRNTTTNRLSCISVPATAWWCYERIVYLMPATLSLSALNKMYVMYAPH